MDATSRRWEITTPAEGGFAPDLDANFEIARQAGTLSNVHAVVAVRYGRIFFERYLAGPGAGLGRPLGVVRFGPDTLHDLRSVSKSGKGQTSQTNFRPVKDRDLEDDWEEVFETLDITADDLEGVIEEAMDHLYDDSFVRVSTRKALEDVARHLADEDDEDDD